MSRRKRTPRARPDRDEDGRRDELPAVAEPEPEDVLPARDRDYVSGAALRRRRIEAGE